MTAIWAVGPPKLSSQPWTSPLVERHAMSWSGFTAFSNNEL